MKTTATEKISFVHIRQIFDFRYYSIFVVLFFNFFFDDETKILYTRT